MSVKEKKLKDLLLLFSILVSIWLIFGCADFGDLYNLSLIITYNFSTDGSGSLNTEVIVPSNYYGYFNYITNHFYNEVRKEGGQEAKEWIDSANNLHLTQKKYFSDISEIEDIKGRFKVYKKLLKRQYEFSCDISLNKFLGNSRKNISNLTISVDMPRKITSSNSSSVKWNTATWQLDLKNNDNINLYAISASFFYISPVFYLNIDKDGSGTLTARIISRENPENSGDKWAKEDFNQVISAINKKFLSLKGQVKTSRLDDRSRLCYEMVYNFSNLQELNNSLKLISGQDIVDFNQKSFFTCDDFSLNLNLKKGIIPYDEAINSPIIRINPPGVIMSSNSDNTIPNKGIWLVDTSKENKVNLDYRVKKNILPIDLDIITMAGGKRDRSIKFFLSLLLPLGMSVTVIILMRRRG